MNTSEYLKKTISSAPWREEYREKLLDLFPTTWTNISNVDLLQLGFKLKLMGVDWRTQEDLAAVLAICEENKLLLRDGYLIRRGNL